MWLNRTRPLIGAATKGAVMTTGIIKHHITRSRSGLFQFQGQDGQRVGGNL